MDDKIRMVMASDVKFGDKIAAKINGEWHSLEVTDTEWEIGIPPKVHIWSVDEQGIEALTTVDLTDFVPLWNEAA